jgi:predicted TIM-barrel fold metal-dependent hydrolase
MLKTLSGLLVLAGFTAVLVWQLGLSQTPTPETKKSGGQASSRYNGPLNSVLLKDFAPKSTLVVEEHHPAKARFPVIDVHIHPSASTPEQVAQWVKAMDDAGVETIVLMSGAVGQNVDRLVDLYLKPYPSRFMLFCGMDTQNIEAPDYPQRAAAELERCYKMGGRGVGEITDKGRGFGQSSYAEATPQAREKRLNVDDRRLDLFWEKCAELKMPINLHIADMPGSWQPPDNHNELGATYAVYNQYGADMPSHDELISRFLTVVERHPRTTFVAVHFANIGNDLPQLGRAFDQHPNLYVDTSARDFEMGRVPFSGPAFFAKYKSRILFGSDLSVRADVYRNWWRLFETRDEFMKGTTWWPIYGLGLPDDILEAVYRGNARRLLNWTKPSP